jgi:hypothetical protein
MCYTIVRGIANNTKWEAATMMALIDKISLLMDELEAAPFERGKEIARELLLYASQMEDYELAQEMQDAAYAYLKKGLLQ